MVGESIKRLVKMLVSLFIYYYDSLIRFCAKTVSVDLPGRTVVICYHSVPQNQRESFARQMDTLVRRVKPIRLEETGKNGRNKQYLVVTFDDGFVGYYENALPEMKKRNVPSLLFVPSQWIGKEADWIILENAGRQLEYVLTEVQLKKIADDPMVEIGSHCLNHSDLCLLKDDESYDEITRSKEELQAITGNEIVYLSFPFGSFNKTHVAIAEQAGYKKVFSVDPYLFPKDDAFVIGRTPVEPEDWTMEFYLKILGCYRWLPSVYSLKAKIRLLMRR